ncbi:MAG: hypothetical protein LBP28_02075 [Coriobacteriales bacterium]|nr:hypothetical protein [Coriobacteriales bacterium]
MDAVREIVDASRLANVMDIPESLWGRRVEVIVLPALDQTPKEEMQAKPYPTKIELDEMLKGSVTESLLGSIPHAPISAAEIRAERLAGKYDPADR